MKMRFMFVYRPPKGSCWGHSFGKDQTTGIPKLEAFFDAFFDRVEQQSPTTLVLAWKDSVLPKVEWPDVFGKGSVPHNSICFLPVPAESEISKACSGVITKF